MEILILNINIHLIINKIKSKGLMLMNNKCHYNFNIKIIMVNLFKFIKFRIAIFAIWNLTRIISENMKFFIK